MNSFELKFEIVDDEVIINRDYYNVKEEQYKQVFSDLDFLGEYKNYKIDEVHTKIGWYRFQDGTRPQWTTQTRLKSTSASINRFVKSMNVQL